jgi:pyridoxine 5-phosphate synthase
MARRLLINIDHIATLRNARGEGRPSVLDAAKVCLENGAEGIVFHLREDRRHIKDFDVNQLKQSLNTFLDFEMGATNEMLKICADTKPNLSTLVPESRQELTTEGGLNMERLFVDFQKRVVPSLIDTLIKVENKQLKLRKKSKFSFLLCCFSK